MSWGEVEVEPEVSDWYRSLNDNEKGRVDFHIDRLEQEGPLLDEPTPNNSSASFASCASISVVERCGSPIGLHLVADHPAHRVRQDEAERAATGRAST